MEGFKPETWNLCLSPAQSHNVLTQFSIGGHSVQHIKAFGFGHQLLQEKREQMQILPTNQRPLCENVHVVFVTCLLSAPFTYTFICSFIHSHTFIYSLTYLLAHSLTHIHLLSHSLSHLHIHLLAHSLTHSLTHLLIPLSLLISNTLSFHMLAGLKDSKS